MDLEPVAQVAEKAVNRTLSRMGARKPASGPVRALFDPICASRFFGYLSRAMTGPAIYRKESFTGRFAQ